MAESIMKQQLKHFSDNQSGPKSTLVHGNRLKGYQCPFFGFEVMSESFRFPFCLNALIFHKALLILVIA